MIFQKVDPMVMDGYNRVVCLSKLTSAIMNSYKEHNMNRDDAQNMAYHVLNFFGFGDRIVDNILEPEDRDLFYMLEDFGLLVTEREETTLYDGREWRIHYWLLKKNAIHSMSCTDDPACEIIDEASINVYDDIPEEAWVRGV
jgi:hypothetical protein